MAAVAAPILLICGIPGAGKTTFARWLEKTKGFLDLDVERDETLCQAGLEELWEEVFTKRSVHPFLDALRKLNRPVVIDWGFPPSCLNIVRALQKQGVQVWWFDGDRAAARRKFIERGTVWVECLDIQMIDIESEWKEIAAVIGANVLNVLDKDGMFLSPEAIYERICSAGQSSPTLDTVSHS